MWLGRDFEFDFDIDVENEEYELLELPEIFLGRYMHDFRVSLPFGWSFFISLEIRYMFDLQ